MSTASDARRRPSLWSYISFGSPRRRSISLPTRNNIDLPGDDKLGSARRNLWGGSEAEAYRDASMTGGQRSRFLKTGGLAFLVFLVLYFLTSKSSAGVRDVVTGTSNRNFKNSTFLIQSQLEKPLLPETQQMLEIHYGRRSARSPVRKINL